MKIRTLTILLFILPSLVYAQDLESKFQAQLDSLFDIHSDAVGVIMHVESPENDLSWTSAIGYSNQLTKEKLNEGHPVLLASNTKPYVAASILRLVELSHLNLSDPIESLLDKKVSTLLKKDGYDLAKITVRHLLSHTSGIADYVDDSYFNFIKENPKHQWEKMDQIKRTVDNYDPLALPGAAFKYGDINFLLLTDIIEEQTNKPFHTVIKELLRFEELGINNTWFEGLEAAPSSALPLAHQYSDEHNWDSYNLNPSWDLYGGGGIASTVEDAAMFMQRLFEGRIIEDPTLLEEMTTYVLDPEQSNYCLGVHHYSFPTFSAYYHGGWWGTDVAYCPEAKSTVAVFTLQKERRNEFAQLSVNFMKQLAALAESRLPEATEPTPYSIGQRFTLHSEILQEDREIYLHYPPGLWGMDGNMDNLPVVYVLDGESQFQNAVTTIDFLSTATNGNDFLPRSLIVGIPNTDRNRDLSPTPDDLGRTGGGPAFLEFMTTELIPYIDANYPTCTHRTLIGHSLGGLLAFEALLKKRDYFDNYIIIDPAVGFNNQTYLNQIIDTFQSAELSEEKVFIAAANNRPSFIPLEGLLKDSSALLRDIDIPLRNFMNKLEQSDWQLNYFSKYYPEENHYSIPHRATYDAMRWLYDYYSFREMTNYYHPHYADKKELLTDLKKHYKTISENMGCEIMPMQGYINSFAFGLAHFGREDISIELLEYNIELHPSEAAMYNNLGYFYRNIGDTSKAIEQFNKSLELQDNPEISTLRDQLLRE